MVTLEFFYLHNHPDRTMELGSIQPLTEMSARVIHVPINMKFGSLNLLESSGPVQKLLYLSPYGEHPYQSCCLLTEAW
jgi:hypothetical protein